jgi:hypothetical protein
MTAPRTGGELVDPVMDPTTVFLGAKAPRELFESGYFLCERTDLTRRLASFTVRSAGGEMWN